MSEVDWQDEPLISNPQYTALKLGRQRDATACPWLGANPGHYRLGAKSPICIIRKVTRRYKPNLSIRTTVSIKRSISTSVQMKRPYASTAAAAFSRLKV
jgi:hypothetical protein